MGKKNNWNIILAKDSINDLSDNNLLKKYNISDSYKIFLENVRMCINEEETIWFLCINDYLEDSRSSFIWDEYKDFAFKYSYDEEEKEEIEYYFNTIVPIFFETEGRNVISGNFNYFGINIETDEIVAGSGLEFTVFEDLKIIADNFEMFLDKIVNVEIEIQ